jgi:UDP-GlcNAc:undecaprenyl-phosphate/decaprenyl-phosphate GlcNAc-1-phosphate transferase
MSWQRLVAQNHRGVEVPRVLGIALAGLAALSTVLFATVRELGSAGWSSLGGLLLVFAAGLVDDLAPEGPRGLRNHLRALASGRVTTGILKLVVITGSAVVVVALQPEDPSFAAIAGVILLAASANVWNGLDVAPGRALKAFLLPAAAFAAWGVASNAPAILGLLAGACLVLPLDLRERAMLGDAGANLLGFAAGLALYDVLPDPWVPVGAVTAVALNVVADTVSFSRVIDRAPPLRWLDRLGRRP